MNGCPWTDADDERLIDLHKSGEWTTYQIGVMLKRSKGSVIGRLHRLGFVRPVKRAPHGLPTYSQNGVTLRHCAIQGHVYAQTDWDAAATSDVREYERAKASSERLS